MANSIIPNNVDPSKDYVTKGVNPPLTTNGLVYNQIYAHIGVIDSLNNTSLTSYEDPNLSIINNSNGLLSFNAMPTTNWFSNADFGGTSAPVLLTYSMSNATYYNNITLQILNVPCFVELGYIDISNNFINLDGTSSFVINGGSDIYTTTDWYNIEYNAPSVLPSTNNIALRITRQQPVVVYGSNGISTNISYSVGVQNFRVKLNIQSPSDIPNGILTVAASGTISGTNYITNQNKFGLVENYNVFQDSITNMYNASGLGYWKSAPQPVGDAVVYFYSQVNSTTPVTINRLYIDPMYSNCNFNVYYTTQTGTADPGTFVWSPIQQDFILRKGIYEIPDTSCTYLKFEFTKLIPEAYDLPFDSVNRTINVFPYDVEEYYSSLEQNIINGNAVKYSSVNGVNIAPAPINQVSPSTTFGLATSTVSNKNTWPSLSALNSSQGNNSSVQLAGTKSQITDPTISYKIIDYNGDYNNQTYNQFLQRRFVNNSVHQYNQVTIPQNWHQSYFVGIYYITAFYETAYDDLRSTPSTFYSSNSTTSGFPYQDSNHIQLMPDTVAYTKYFSTIDSFKSFNVAGLTTDWRSFLTQGASPNNDPTLMNNIDNVLLSMQLTPNTALTRVGQLGPYSQIYSVSGSGTGYGIQSPSYPNTNVNLLSYNDSNFISSSGRTLAGWYNVSGVTASANTSVNWTGTINNIPVPGNASGISITGTDPMVAYNFTLPNIYNASGTVAWGNSLGSAPYGGVGYASYSPTSGTSYYFAVNAQSLAAGTTNLSFFTQFVNPSNNIGISNTLVPGSTLALTSGIGLATLSGTNYTASGIPSNTIQMIVSGSGSSSFSLYQNEVSSSPFASWQSPTDRSNMRISGVARIYLPNSNQGTYRVSLIGKDINNNSIEVAYKLYTAGTMPVKTWFDIELTGYTANNLGSFTCQVQQINPSISEIFYISMLAPFYHPIRYEFSTTAPASGQVISTGNWYPIAGGLNDPNYAISVASGVTASGIQLRITGLDPNVYIAGTSIIPNYKQSPFYASLPINYLGSSKTNEIESRTAVEYKPYFQLNHESHPAAFDIQRISGTTLLFSID